MGEISTDLRQFPAFAAGVSLGLLKAALTEPEILALVVSGFLLGSDSARQRAFGKALVGWIIARQADKYVGVIDSNLSLLRQVIRDNPRIQVMPDG